MLAALAACGGGSGGSVAESGTLRLALTDAPSCGYDKVNITVEKVRVHQSSNANDSDAGWAEVVLNPARRIDLLNLQNGILDELGQVPLPTGKYTQLRMILADNTGSNPPANSVVLTGTVSPATEVALKTPSGQQSGVKANINIDIAANKLADFVIDFDACKSVVVAGNSGQYLLKPVVRVTPRYISAVAGFVSTQISGSTTVSVQQNGVVIKATAPDSNGKFLLQPVAPGLYTLVLTAPGRATSVITSVSVVTDTVALLNTAASALSLSTTSQMGTVTGTITPTSTPTLVLALQTLTSGPIIEVVGGSFVGSYFYALPVAAPQVAPYVAPLGTLAFAADSAVAGKYTLRASQDGKPTQTAVLGTLTGGATITTNFTFP